MIRLKVAPYCHECMKFEPFVIKSQTFSVSENSELIAEDVIIECQYKELCRQSRKLHDIL